MLELKNVHKSFGSNTVFTIPELCLPAGIYWLRGANGSGKSTLLNILAGLLPFKGEIYLNKTISVKSHRAEYRRYINHAPADPAFPSFISGDQLVEFARVIKKGSSEQAGTIKQALGIGDYLAQPTGSYSSGMLKKLSLLMAFTGRPAWILLDEPFTTLDQASQLALTGLIRSQHRLGISFIITSHHDIEPENLQFAATFFLKDHQLLKNQ